MDAVKTIEPLMPSLMNFRAATRAQKNAPNSHVLSETGFVHIESLTLMSKRSCISSSEKSSAALWFVRPAFTTIPCNAPASPTIDSITFVIESSLVTFAVLANRRPGKRLATTRKSSPGSAMSIEYTRSAPLVRQHSAMPSPIPRLAPVTVSRQN